MTTLTFTAIILALINSIIVNNVILSKTYGICPFLGVSTKVKSAVGMGAAVTAVLVVAAALTYPLYRGLLETLNITYMQIIAFILVIASIVQLVEMVLKKFSKGLYKALGVYLPLITTNCAVLGVAQDNIVNTANYSFWSGYLYSVVVAFGTGLGFLLVMFLFSTIRTRLETANTSKAFKGVPLAFITAGLLALAFMGFNGLFSIFA